jgi:hypothetical protein
VTREELVDGRWYWVRMGDGDWFPAVYDRQSVGGWSNEDTWEDFHAEVTDWRLIEPPTVGSPVRDCPKGGHVFVSGSMTCQRCGWNTIEGLDGFRGY